MDEITIFIQDNKIFESILSCFRSPDRNTSSKIRKYEMEYFSSLQDFFFRENEYLWIFPFHREKIDNICHDWKSRDRSNLRIYWFIWRNKGIICRCQLEDECRYHLRPPFDTRENENFDRRQTASPSSPSLPSTSHLLSSSINTPVKRYSGFVTGEKRIRLKHSLALVYNLKSSPDKTSKDRGHSLIPLPQRCVHRPMKISQFLMLDTSFLLLSLILQSFSLLFSQLIVTRTFFLEYQLTRYRSM